MLELQETRSGAPLGPGAGAAVAVDEAGARRALRAQVARLEAELGEAVAGAFGQTVLDARVPAAPGGPRLLGLGELEALRDALAARLSAVRAELEAHGARVEADRVRLEHVLLAPGRHRSVRLRRADLDLDGCGVFQVRPRLGIVGMLTGWWHVKLSSGCPRAT
jgi:hypothetical protein